MEKRLAKKETIIISDDECEIIITKPKSHKRVIEDDEHEEAKPTSRSRNDIYERKMAERKASNYSSKITIKCEIVDHDSMARCYNSIFETFPNLNSATGYRTYKNVLHCPIFARDIYGCKIEGPKAYIPAPYNSVFAAITKSYSSYGKDGKCIIPSYYEIVEEKRLCNIFLDLEYDYDVNEGVEPAKALKDFVTDFHLFMTEIGVINETRKVKTTLLHCHSTTKASFHVHFAGSNWIMEDLYSVGALVRNFVVWTMGKYGNDVTKHPYFFKKTGKKDRIFFADLAIYTLNRPFRLAYCAKSCGEFGRLPFLTPGEWLSIDYDSTRLSEIKPDVNIYMNSIPCYTEPGVSYQVLTSCNPDGSISTSTSYTGFWSHPSFVMNKGTKFVRSDEINEPITKLCETIVSDLINNEAKVYVLGHDSSNNVVTVGTYSSKCPIKMQYENVQYHSSNHVYYCVHYMANYILCKCKNQSCSKKKPYRYEINKKWLMRIIDAVPASIAELDERICLNEVNSMLAQLETKLTEMSIKNKQTQ